MPLDTNAKYSVRHAKEEDKGQIIRLVDDEARATGALLPLTEEVLGEWISAGLSLVAETVVDGKNLIVAHEAANVWPKCGWIEFRSSIVKPEFRGNGISTKLSKTLFNIVKDRYPGVTMIAFVNHAGNGKGILQALGFSEANYADIPAEILSIGPKHRGKAEHGYRVFVRRG
ncbi:MAG: hypothetical protein KGH72_04635 [Candidatus Micrarchaeota archaeon]|nr:hypothetical protein [Candidatus Micrarchaeota archaeon]